MADRLTSSNPFATRYTRPGAIEYLFPPGQSAAMLVDRLRQQSWWGAILGPHGAGKSTLLHTLERALEDAGRTTVHFTLNPQERTLPVHASDAANWNESTQVVVDGYEQLGWWGRLRLKSLCRRRGAGLLVTAHAPVDIVELYRVEPTLEVAEQVVAHLLADQQAELSQPALAEQPNSSVATDVITRDDIARAFERQQGNVRETLFELFDLYRRKNAAS